MNPQERLALAAAILAGSVLVGRLLRHRLNHAADPIGVTKLPAGLVLLTAPYCTRCAHLQDRLNESGVTFTAVSVADNTELVQATGTMSAPTLLAIGPEGHVLDHESRDFSDKRLASLAATRS